jgi:hypothetical protein
VRQLLIAGLIDFANRAFYFAIFLISTPFFFIYILIIYYRLCCTPLAEFFGISACFTVISPAHKISGLAPVVLMFPPHQFIFTSLTGWRLTAPLISIIVVSVYILMLRLMMFKTKLIDDYDNTGDNIL